MKKAICLLIALSLLLSLGACAANKPSSRPQEVVSGGGAIHFSSSEADREPAVPENPPAVPEEEGPSYAPIPSSSTPSYASSSISYPSSSSSSSSSPAILFFQRGPGAQQHLFQQPPARFPFLLRL